MFSGNVIHRIAKTLPRGLPTPQQLPLSQVKRSPTDNEPSATVVGCNPIPTNKVAPKEKSPSFGCLYPSGDYSLGMFLRCNADNW
jgi:hypothetical protein